MSDFEGVIPFVLVPAAISWWRWYGSIFSVNRLASRMRDRAALLTVPISCIGLLLVVLRLAASSDVRTDPFYLSFYVALGAGWLGVATFVFPLLGISVRDDVVERHNPSASWALSGALIAVTLCFAGANIGNGPGPYAVLFCAVLATLAFFLLWFGVEMLAAPSEAIAVERDKAAGIRLGGLLVALAIILGGAVAGPWESVSGTMRDFFQIGWPASLLAGIAAVVEKSHERGARPALPVLGSGAIALVYVAAAALYIAVRGNWS